MLRGIERIAFSMKIQEDRMNVIATNIANVNTRAYKKEVLSTKSFDEVMIDAIKYGEASDSSRQIGSISLGVSADENRINYSQGNIQQTGFDTDLAILGEGFFVLDTPYGTRYTRAGNFRFDEEGFLVSNNSNYKCYVMGENGRIQDKSKHITVAEDGKIKNGDKLLIADFNDLKVLKKADNGSYINDDPQNLKANENSSVMQRYLEDSNVSIVEETRDMLDTKRKYESCQQMIMMMDQMLGRAVNDIGSV